MSDVTRPDSPASLPPKTSAESLGESSRQTIDKRLVRTRRLPGASNVPLLLYLCPLHSTTPPWGHLTATLFPSTIGKPLFCFDKHFSNQCDLDIPRHTHLPHFDECFLYSNTHHDFYMSSRWPAKGGYSKCYTGYTCPRFFISSEKKSVTSRFLPPS